MTLFVVNRHVHVPHVTRVIQVHALLSFWLPCPGCILEKGFSRRNAFVDLRNSRRAICQLFEKTSRTPCHFDSPILPLLSLPKGRQTDAALVVGRRQEGGGGGGRRVIESHMPLYFGLKIPVSR